MRKIPWFLYIILFFMAWGLFQFLVSLYPNLLWFDNLGFASVFWINLKAKVLTGIVFALFFAIIAGLNVFIAKKLAPERPAGGRKRGAQDIKKFIQEMFGESSGGEESDDEGLINVTPSPELAKRFNLFWALGIFAVSIFMGLSAATQWQVVLKALNAVSFGLSDPVFGYDVGFYIFNFPLQRFAQGFIFSALVISLIAMLWIYVTSGAVTLALPKIKLAFSRGVKTHLALLLAVLSLIFAWGLWLGELEILYSSRGVVYGAGYTDVKAQLLGYNLQIFVLAVIAALFIIYIFRSDWRILAGGIGAYFVVAVVMGGIYPAIVQGLQVNPSEISLESPYIKHGIKFTRIGYGLNNIEEKEFAAEVGLTSWDLRRNDQTIHNVRLWDHRPLVTTYRQLQGIRLYYDFTDVDIDRYQINGTYQQVMLSARELKVDKLPEQAQTWVNQHLKFTHGYGLCLSPVNEQTPDGLPALLVKDIPPVTNTGLKITRPEIYYGEETDGYVLVKTTEQEFDYPKGDKNVYSDYKGRGGVQISSLLRRLAFTVTFSDLRILLTDYITKDSRIMFDRNIHRRVRKVAPFFKYDLDPYMVISEGRQFWIQDAYTTSDLFPYSEPTGSGFGQFNYIRNSVKIVIDAYNGDMAFYIVDDNDPIVKTYQKIYPALFKPLAEMPEDIKKHMRYPYDLFMVQANKYARFHMQDPQVYYNQEDLWNIPKEIMSGGGAQRMDGYYVIMKLPEERREEFLLMLPFTPNNKDNMIAWLAGRSDGDNYGKLIVYKFPKDKLVYGPMQIEARIDQQTEISELFTLWGQSGSRVIRGDLLAIPIEQSILYVEPIYLEASTGALPELKRVIVAYGKNVVMRETLDQALSDVFAGRVTPRRRAAVSVGLNTRQLAQKAMRLYNEAYSQLRQGNLARFDEKLREMRQVLQQMAK